MAKIDAEKLNTLLSYLDAWQASWSAYQEWYRREYSKRFARYELKRDKARVLINQYLTYLDTDKFGRIRSDTKSSRIKIRNFAKKRDRVLQALAIEARKIFGYKGHVDPKTGIFIGSLDPRLNKLVKKKLDVAFTKLAGDLNAVE